MQPTRPSLITAGLSQFGARLLWAGWLWAGWGDLCVSQVRGLGRSASGARRRTGISHAGTRHEGTHGPGCGTYRTI